MGLVVMHDNSRLDSARLYLRSIVQVFLYCSGNKIVGCALAERLERAYLWTDDERGDVEPVIDLYVRHVMSCHVMCTGGGGMGERLI